MPFVKRIFARLSHSNVKRQLLGIFLLAVLLPVSLLSGVLMTTFHSTSYQQYVNLINSDNQRVTSIMFDVTSHLHNVAENLASDPELANLLETQFSSPEKASISCSGYNRFQSVLRDEPAVSSIRVYTLNTSIAQTRNLSHADLATRKSEWFKKAAHSYTPFWQTNSRKDNFGNVIHEATLYRHVTLVKSHSYAVLAITLSSNYLRNQIENNTLCSVIAINSEPVFYSTWSELEGKLMPVSVARDTFYQKRVSENTVDNLPCLVSTSTLLPNQTTDSITIVSLDSHALPTMEHSQHMLLLLLLFIGAISCLIIIFFTRYFSVRVECLRDAMHRACNNDYLIIDNFRGNDELADTFRDLQALVEQVKATEERFYTEQLNEQKLLNEQQRMEYQMLSNQLNPHFLYNTLETIRMKALTEGNRDVATAIKLLGKSMRYVLENTGTSSAPLQKELDYISVYMQIQHLRFGDRIQYALHLAPEVDPTHCEILPLLLQPVIENAISHGFADITSGGLIDLDIRLLGTSVLSLTVTDNGAGMPPETLQKLRQDLKLSRRVKNRHIGLYNINQRILLCYGECFGLKINSTEGKGTTVNLTIPYHTV